MNLIDKQLSELRIFQGSSDSFVDSIQIDGSPAQYAPWPSWLDERVKDAFHNSGIDSLYTHQVLAADAMKAGKTTVIATGTGSGKSLAAWLKYLHDVSVGAEKSSGKISDYYRHPTALYVSPTKALARSQGLAVQEWSQAGDLGIQVGYADGDTSTEAKRWARAYADVVVTNPDYLHFAMLPGSSGWKRFLGNLTLIIIDELHYYRGVMGGHVSLIIRRLLRLAKLYGANPQLCFLSATTANPSQAAARMSGVEEDEIAVIDEDGSGSGNRTIVLWQPRSAVTEDDLLEREFLSDPWLVQSPLTAQVHDQEDSPQHLVNNHAEEQAPVDSDEGPRRSVIVEAGQMLTHLMSCGARVLTFVGSRYGAEAVSDVVKSYTSLRWSELLDKVASYRGGYLPEERRSIEKQLRDGKLLGLATTSALELGIDIAGLDATISAGWPGTRSSFRQQSGRAGRAGNDGLSVLIAGDNPLDQYMLHHPEEIIAGVEATIFHPYNPYIVEPHLCCAAAEAAVSNHELDDFGPEAKAIAEDLVAQGVLKARPSGLMWNPGLGHPWEDVDIRGAGYEVTIVDSSTGTVIGAVDDARADSTVFVDAIYVHQGQVYRVIERDDITAYVEKGPAHLRTKAFDDKAVEIIDITSHSSPEEPIQWFCGTVEVTTHVHSYGLYRLPKMTFEGEFPLDNPHRTLRTQATWLTVSPSFLLSLGIYENNIGNALHGAEHAFIGLLPAVTTCDRWDIGGLSISGHHQTQLPTIFVYDGYEGGAGFSASGFHARQEWTQATEEAVRTCQCSTGCPRCIHSPKCGNNNEYLSKSGAKALLGAIVKQLDS